MFLPILEKTFRLDKNEKWIMFWIPIGESLSRLERILSAEMASEQRSLARRQRGYHVLAAVSLHSAVHRAAVAGERSG